MAGPKNIIEGGSLVPMKEDNFAPNKWILRRIIKVVKGSDSWEKVVELRTHRFVLKRSISKLCLLPLEEIV